MAKRYDTRRIKKHQSYTVEEAAELLDVHEQTVRAWIDRGLRCMRTRLPFLVLGQDLKKFLENRVAASKRPLKQNEL